MAMNERPDRNAVTIEAFELPRHFAVARHHVKQTDHRYDGSVGRAQEQQAENNSDDPAENLPDPGRKRGGGKLFADEAQHVFAALPRTRDDISSRFVRCNVFPSTEGSESIAQPRSAVPMTTSIATGVIALSDSRATLGCSIVDPGSSFITPVRFAIDSAPDNARITPTNCTHTVPRL